MRGAPPPTVRPRPLLNKEPAHIWSVRLEWYDIKSDSNISTTVKNREPVDGNFSVSIDLGPVEGILSVAHAEAMAHTLMATGAVAVTDVRIGHE